MGATKDQAAPGAPWRKAIANDAEASLDARLLTEAVEEFVDNMKRNYGIDLSQGLPNYGLMKCLAIASIVSRAAALGIDPEVLAFSRIDDLMRLDSEAFGRILKAAEKGEQIPANYRVELQREASE